MSHEELQKKVEDIEKKQFRSTYVKAGAFLVGCAGVCFTMGMTYGSWEKFRRDTEDMRVDYYEFKPKIQKEVHDLMVMKNASVKGKG